MALSKISNKSFPNSTNTNVGWQSFVNNTSSYNTAVGYQAGYSNSTGVGITAFGANALYATTASDNCGIGTDNPGNYKAALESNTTGRFNTAVATGALGDNTTGQYNTGIGHQALASNTTASYNTALGYQSSYVNTTGQRNTAIGYYANRDNTTGSYNVALGMQALNSNTTATNNTAIGYQAGYSNTTGNYNTFVGSTSGYSFNGSPGGNYFNTCVGHASGYSLTTGERNTFVGAATNTGAAGYYVTTGSKNTILGAYNGNQDSLDIRTASNWIILSDGDGNARFGSRNDGWTWFGSYRSSGYNRVSYPSGVTVNQGDVLFGVSGYPSVNEDTLLAYAVGSSIQPSTSGAAFRVFRNTSTNRSINASGTINASGADYAEYMTKSGDFTITKGDVVGVDANGELTNIFADAVSFVVKSTNPSYVGGDTWFVEQPRDENHDFITSGPEYDAWVIAQDAARQKVDRVAFAGQVPVNVVGATPGQYIVPVEENGAIKGQAVSNPTFEQYQSAVGKVIAIEQDGRARIIVKVV